MIYPKCKKGLHHNILLSLAREIFIINTKEKEEEKKKQSKRKNIYKEREKEYIGKDHPRDTKRVLYVYVKSREANMYYPV